MFTDIKITYTHQADLKAENKCVVVFSEPPQSPNAPFAVAWQVIKSSENNDPYRFDYPFRTLAQATWDNGRKGTSRKEVTTSSLAIEVTANGIALNETESGATPNQFSVVNTFGLFPGMTITAFKANKPIMRQSQLAKEQRVDFLLPPKLCWAVMPSPVAVGDTIDLENINYQEVSLQDKTDLSVTLKGSVEEGYQFIFSDLTQKPPLIEQVSLAPTLTIDCALSVLAAYSDDEKQRHRQLPPGYKYVTRFTGWDQFLNGTGRKERFGLILQSLSNPSTYLIAFRGTASLEDAYEDLWVNTVPFQPYSNQTTFPDNVLVADGFNSIYSMKGENMRLSMQEQLFKKLKKLTPAPQEIITTGHSLGAPLASLFTLDLAHSYAHSDAPNIRLTNITFASPRVGLQTWKEIYNKTYNLEPVTYRIANYWDIIPSLPPENLNYEHIGQQFLVSFYVKDAWFPHYMERHSLANYATVLDKAVHLDPQIYVGDFDDVTERRTLTSTVPPSVNVPAWAKIIKEVEQTTVPH